jgi:hypothetical protein
LASIDLAASGGGASARLAQDGEPVFAIRAPWGGERELRDRTGYNLTLRGGKLRRIAGTVGGRGLSFALAGQPPEIGEVHPLECELRTLGLPKRPLLTASLAHARMRFDLPEAL